MAGNYVKGWYNQQKPYLYVSKGFGTSTVLLRLGARAEIAMFEYFTQYTSDSSAFFSPNLSSL
ncbi:hypothetical protein [Telluribacter humicola]|uniref:hypothetical protein n=1 Tax=Telluribacter humicola TaxID=1720261 RepID=UPI001A9758F0|nr:hypothetical protein [Telluribacter humicola]